ncbi:hypothetical protein LIA77_09847 [Sarocladium implicatum]|nr:hypothetical protein LIA77_09847 [Sarocladium implicatum]
MRAAPVRIQVGTLGTYLGSGVRLAVGSCTRRHGQLVAGDRNARGEARHPARLLLPHSVRCRRTDRQARSGLRVMAPSQQLKSRFPTRPYRRNLSGRKETEFCLLQRCPPTCPMYVRSSCKSTSE